MQNATLTDLTASQSEISSAAEELNLRLVILFGSHAHGRPAPGPDSDLDIAVRVGTPDARERFWPIQRALSAVFLDRALDLVVLDGADSLLRWEVMRDGILLHGDPLEFLEYRAYAYRDFVDSADLRELEHALFQRKMTWIGSQLDAPT